MGAFLQMLRNLGPLRLAVMGGLLVGLLIFFTFLTTQLASPQMALLFGDLEIEDSSRIVSELEGMGVPFEIRQNGRQIHVPAEQALRLRLSLAQEGLPSGGSMGYEIFDRSDSLGTTNFVQNVNLVRALEGELARTIRSIQVVKSARVHLVLPRRELFSRERREPSASVILGMRGSIRLGPEQVTAIQHLVAAAVPDLSPGRISIVDDRGSLLARGFEDKLGAGTLGADSDERRRAYELRLSRTIEELLEKTVGFGNVRAEVSAEMDFDRINTAEETFDPDGQVVRSTQTIEETVSSRDAEGTPAVSVAINLPDAGGGSDSASSTSAEQRTEETVNFEISKKVVNHVRDTGVVTRLSVAVLVDGTYSEGADGEPVYEPREQAALESLATLARTSVGFDANRGDNVEVINMQFALPEEPEEEALELFFGFDKNDVLRMAEILVLSIVAVLVILLVVRPLLARAFEALPTVARAAEARLLAVSEAGAAPALTGPGGVLPPGDAAARDEESLEELIDIDRVEGRVRASTVKKVGEIVQKHPDEALSIVRSWMYQGT